MIVKDEMAYPEPGDGKRLRWIYAAILAAMVVVFCCFRLWMDTQFSSDDPEDIRAVFLVLSGAIAATALAVWLWIFSISRRVLRAEQWPYPGAKLARPVAFLRGAKALARAWTLLALGSLFSIALIAASAYLYFGIGARIVDLVETRLQQSKGANTVLHASYEAARA